MLGYVKDILDKLFYVRARLLRVDVARWMTIDRLWPEESAYAYVDDRPSVRRDASGLGAYKCERCAAVLFIMYMTTYAHHCCHCFIHCLVCCILNHEFDADCARGAQGLQNGIFDKGNSVTGYRSAACEKGIAGNVDTRDCAKHCRKAPDCECDNSGEDCFPPITVPKWPLGGHLPDICYNASPFIRYCFWTPLGAGG
jgi:hypothetical protein